MARAALTDDIPALYRGLVVGLRPVLMAGTRRAWSGGEHVPAGGCVVAANHLSQADPLALAHFLVDHGRAPRFLAKHSLFRLPVTGSALRAIGQIPVERGTGRAVDAFTAAVAAVRRGACVAVMPEGTLTRDPDLWPMAGRTGAARIALETGAPLVPVAMWGPQDVLWPYRGRVPRVLPPKTMAVRAGAPVDLTDVPGPWDAAALRLATDRLMARITAELEQLRGERR